ncbi:MAG: SDR family NAD(P)-dependent oxidoreductase, partial [Ignavibacteriales bacterium]|nr:SDR family NAD(P)-dependent oxidoreductase [Ignavibacteriales bacterium]
IVTGASKGIGSEIAVTLAKEGVSVVLAARNSEALTSLQLKIEKMGGIARAIPTDVTSEHSVKNLVLETLTHFGTIDILINNAGVGVYTNVIDMKTADYEAMMNVNLKGVFLSSREVLSTMIKQKRGEIINIASLAGKNSFAGGSVYSATKWGLIGFGRSLMLEVRDHNIRVVTICPGSVNTHFADKERDQPEIIQPEDVAETVLFALTMPNRVNVSEIDIRPTIKPR